MKSNLLKKLILSTVITTALSACDTDNGNEELFDDNLQPVMVSGDPLTFELGEYGEIRYGDLLTGATNPEESTDINARNLVYLEQEKGEDGLPLNPPVWTYEGPKLPASVIRQTQNVLIFDTTELQDVLVHPVTIERHGDMICGATGNQKCYSQGVYSYSYILDNGAEELVERGLEVTILGEEVVIEDIDVVETIEVAKDFTSNLNATIMPSNTTFDIIGYTSSNTSIATVDADGVISGIAYGTFTITVTSEDGSVTKTVSGEVIPLTNPLGVDINVDGSAVSSANIPVEETLQFSSTLLPVYDPLFTNDVVWSSDNPTVISIDAATGLATANKMYKTETPATETEPAQSNTVMITATVQDVDGKDVHRTIPVRVVTGKNYFYFSDPGFEGGDYSQSQWKTHWDTPPGSIVEIIPEAAKTGMYGLHISSNGAKQSGVYLPKDKFAQDVGQGPGRWFKVSYDYKLNSYLSGNPANRFYFIPSAWGDRIEKWHAVTGTTEWQHAEVTFEAGTYNSNNPNDAAYFILQTLKLAGDTPIDVYYDNIRLEEVPNPNP